MWCTRASAWRRSTISSCSSALAPASSAVRSATRTSSSSRARRTSSAAARCAVTSSTIQTLRPPGSLRSNGRPDRRAQNSSPSRRIMRCSDTCTRPAAKSRAVSARARCQLSASGYSERTVAPVTPPALHANSSSILRLQCRVRPFSTTAMPSTAVSRMAWFSSSASRSDSSSRLWRVRSSMIQTLPCSGSSGLTM